MLAVNPSGVLFSIGAPAWTHTALNVISGLTILVATWFSLRAIRKLGVRNLFSPMAMLGVRIASVVVAFVALNAVTVGSVSAYLDDHILELAVWQPEGMVEFSRAAGMMGFLAYSQHIEAAERDNFLEYQPSEPPPAWEDVQAAVGKIINLDALSPALSPNIVIVHAESIFDPNDVLNLEFPVENPLFYSDIHYFR